jgi:uncharacterized membrane protein YphA (DoxX/SURF4 family)
VWLINGLFCKLLNLVPRHQQIVARILGDEYAGMLTKAIGALEILIVVWLISGIKSRWCSVTQIVLVASMNIIEFILAPDLLLFGRMNIVLAACFITVLVLNEFVFHRQPFKPTFSN